MIEPLYTIDRGIKYPYDTLPNQSWEYIAARTILADLKDRSGIKQGFNDVDEDIRNEVVKSMASYILACHTQFKEQS